jgi:hypothetical protein
MMTKLLKYSCSIALILSCAGCLRKPINLKPLTKESAHDSQTKEQVIVHAKRLNFEDQENMFGNDANQLAKQHIVPVQITVENSSKTSWLLTDKNISLKLLSIDEVNKTLFTAKRLIPLWIFLGGLGIILIAGAPTTIPALIAIGTNPLAKLALIIFASYSAAALSLPLCIAAIDGIINHISKKQMHKYLKTYCNIEGITINPDINASMLFFVEESDLPEKLNLLLVDKNTGKNTIPFELNL